MAQKEKEPVATDHHKTWVKDFTELFVWRKKRVALAFESHVPLQPISTSSSITHIFKDSHLLITIRKGALLVLNNPLLIMHAIILSLLCLELFPPPCLLFSFHAMCHKLDFILS